MRTALSLGNIVEAVDVHIGDICATPSVLKVQYERSCVKWWATAIDWTTWLYVTLWGHYKYYTDIHIGLNVNVGKI